jgi:prepilin-type N-terminal cleavage/methylation domain-containing protein
MMGRRGGFTLVELLVVAVVGVLLVMATYQVLVVNQRTYTVQNEKVRAQQSTRAAMDVLFNELREVSSRGGDILAYDAASLTARVMRAYGIVCGPDWTTTPQFRVRPEAADSFFVGDSVFVYADNDEAAMSDDAWVLAAVSSVGNGVSCPNGDGAQDLTFSGYTAAFEADSVRTGAPVRAFTTLEYGLFTLDGEPYLGRRVPGGDWVPIVGPLAPPDAAAPGLEFAYFDASGTVATNAAAIREIQVTLRAVSGARTMSGVQVSDSIVGSIYTRN